MLGGKTTRLALAIASFFPPVRVLVGSHSDPHCRIPIPFSDSIFSTPFCDSIFSTPLIPIASTLQFLLCFRFSYRCLFGSCRFPGSCSGSVTCHRLRSFFLSLEISCRKPTDRPPSAPTPPFLPPSLPSLLFLLPLPFLYLIIRQSFVVNRCCCCCRCRSRHGG